MPTCCVKNCRSRTSTAFYDNVAFYSFPQNPNIRRKWLEACGKDPNHQIKYERVCGMHFKPECVETRIIKSQSTLTKSRIRRLRIGSVPTELLELPNVRQKRFWSYQSYIANEFTNKSFCSGIPSYTELVAYTNAVDEKDTVSVLNNDTEDVQVSDTDEQEKCIDLSEDSGIPSYIELVAYTNAVDEKDTVSILNNDTEDVQVSDTDEQEKCIDLSEDSGIPSYTELVSYTKAVDEKDTVSVLNNDTEDVQVSDTDEQEKCIDLSEDSGIPSYTELVVYTKAVDEKDTVLNNDTEDVQVSDTNEQEKCIDLNEDVNLPTAAELDELDKFTNNTTEDNIILKSAKKRIIKCTEGYNTFYIKISYPSE